MGSFSTCLSCFPCHLPAVASSYYDEPPPAPAAAGGSLWISGVLGWAAMLFVILSGVVLVVVNVKLFSVIR